MMHMNNSIKHIHRNIIIYLVKM